MARKRKVIPDTVQDPIQESVDRCGLCASASGYCMPGCDGSPIACRCPRRPFRLVMVSERACPFFVQRAEAPPERVPYGYSTDFIRERESARCVPLFRTKGPEPWKVVPVTDIYPKSILSDGTLV